MDRNNKENWKGSREGFGEALVKLREINPKVVVMTCDLMNSVRAEAFKNKFPDRFFEFGVAEQNMMGIAAGMSLAGYLPYVCTYGVFSAGRCWEQLRLSVCYSGCNVKVEGAHSGLLVGPDGASHQATEDIATTRAIPNLKVVVPCDTIEARKATFSIRDRGIGIPAQDIEQLFHSFHRGSNVENISGTGLGVSIVKQCVDLHSGEISVTSEVGIGTTFVVTLPI